MPNNDDLLKLALLLKVHTMKKLYHLPTIILCTFFSITARPVKTRIPLTATKITPVSSLPIHEKYVPESPTISSIKTYKQLLDDITKMKSDMVVAPDGIFTDYFITFVKDNAEKSQLSDVFTRALLEAGMSLHAQLNGNDAFILRALKRNTQQVGDIMNPLKPATTQEQPQGQQTTSAMQLEQSQQQLPKPKESSSEPSAPRSKTPAAEPKQQPLKSKEPSPQPIASQPKKPLTEPNIKSIPQPKPSEYKKDLSGSAGLKEFRKQSINEPLKTLYSDGRINTEWLIKALHIVLSGQPLTSKNKEKIKGELIGNTTELIREILHKNQIAGHLWNLFIEDVKKQTIAFMDNQPLSDQKQISLPTLSTKTPQKEPIASRPKTPVFEPQPKMPQKPDRDPSLPDWMTPRNTLIIKELEIEILRYIFENPQVNQEIIAQHFIQQIPKNIKTKEILINGIKAIVGKTLQEPLEPNIPAKEPQVTLQKSSSKDKLPYWIDAKGFNVRPSDLDKEIATFIATNMDANNDDIANHFIDLIPHDMSHKRLIERQIRDSIEDFIAR